MKKILASLILTVALVFGCSTMKPIESPYNFNKPGEIMITGNISDSDFQGFYALTSYGLDEYKIILNTNGGAAQACVGIMTRIEELQAKGVKFHTTTYSKAYSAGFFIWMMGDKRTMGSGSTLMVHTTRAQNAVNQKYQIWDAERHPLQDRLDEWVIAKTFEKLPNVDPMTLETMLRYDGMTFFNDVEAKQLGMF